MNHATAPQPPSAEPAATEGSKVFLPEMAIGLVDAEYLAGVRIQHHGRRLTISGLGMVGGFSITVSSGCNIAIHGFDPKDAIA